MEIPSVGKRATYGQKIASFIRPHDDIKPGAVHPSEEACVANEEDGLDTSGKHDIDPALVHQETGSLGVLVSNIGADRHSNDDVLFLPLETVDGVDAKRFTLDVRARSGQTGLPDKGGHARCNFSDLLLE